MKGKKLTTLSITLLVIVGVIIGSVGFTKLLLYAVIALVGTAAVIGGLVLWYLGIKDKVTRRNIKLLLEDIPFLVQQQIDHPDWKIELEIPLPKELCNDYAYHIFEEQGLLVKAMFESDELVLTGCDIHKGGDIPKITLYLNRKD